MTRQGSLPRPWRWTLALASVGLVLSGCSLHVSKHGASGSIFGHSFSGANGELPSGFPSNVPVPSDSRVLIGGGADNNWDAVFAVTGSITAGTAAYQAKLQSAGYSITNVHAGTTPVTGPPVSNSNSPSTTVTLTGSIFTAANAQWTVQVESASTSSSGTGLRAGEFAINMTIVPASTSTSAT
jgi:hypothetical protein